jgi:hypothetical protein
MKRAICEGKSKEIEGNSSTTENVPSETSQRFLFKKTSLRGAESYD